MGCLKILLEKEVVSHHKRSQIGSSIVVHVWWKRGLIQTAPCHVSVSLFVPFAIRHELCRLQNLASSWASTGAIVCVWRVASIESSKRVLSRYK